MWWHTREGGEPPPVVVQCEVWWYRWGLKWRGKFPSVRQIFYFFKKSLLNYCVFLWLFWNVFVARHYIAKIHLVTSVYVEVLTFDCGKFKALWQRRYFFFFLFEFTAKQSDHKNSIPESFSQIWLWVIEMHFFQNRTKKCNSVFVMCFNSKCYLW